MSASTPHRVHYRAEGRTFVPCSTAPQIHTTTVAAEVTCATCLRALRERWERTRPLPQINTRRTA